MGLFSRIFLGVDVDEEQRRSDELDRKLDAENARDAVKYGPEWQAMVRENQERDGSGYNMDVEAEVDEAFEEGLQEGADNITAVVSKPFDIAGAGIGALLKAVPWWVWAAAALGLFIQLGGMTIVRSKLIKAAK
jgi:hypothetical protein